MRVTLVNPVETNDPTLGLGYLASFLRRETGGVDVAIHEGPHRIVERVLASSPDLVGVTTVTATYTEAASFARRLRAASAIPIVLGGPHITALPESMGPEVDVAVLGEGEATLVELVELLRSRGRFDPSDLAGIEGVAFRSGDGLEKTNARAMIEPLDTIPFPDRSLYDMEKYLKPSMRDGAAFIRATTQLSARGCPYRCVFCHPSLVWRKTRLHSPEYVVAEIAELVERYHVRAVLMSDDLFLMNRPRLESLVELLGRKDLLGKLRFFCETRPNLLTEETVRLLKELNVVEVALGIESAAPRILKYLKRGAASVEVNRRAVDLVHANGMNVYTFVIIGSPTETPDEMLQTLDFVSDPRVTRFSVAIATPFPGTELWEYARKRGLVSPDMDWRRIFAQPAKGRPAPVYLNEETVPYDRFLEIYSRFEDLKFQKWLSRTMPRLSWNHAVHFSRRVISDPRSLLRLAGKVRRSVRAGRVPSGQGARTEPEWKGEAE